MTTLYKLDSRGKVRVWRAWVTLNEDGSATEYNEAGVEGGSLSGIPITTTEGKNIGKKNETTPFEQAEKNVQSKYDKKIRAGYVEDLGEYVQQGVMAAQTWEVSKHRMSKLALHQPKLDGIRCKASMSQDGKLKLMSKSNKEFKPFLYETAWAKYFSENLSGDIDGEMYIHGVELNNIASLVMSYKFNQEEFLSYCKDTEEGLHINLKPKQILDQVYVGDFNPETAGKSTIFPGYTVSDVAVIGTSDLEFWAFDTPDETSAAEARNNHLREEWDTEEAKRAQIFAVVAEEFDIDDIEDVNGRHLVNLFEGTMVRHPAELYAYGKRSAGLLKFKLFHDSEWAITGYTLDKQGNPTFTFMSDAGYEFASRPKGTRAWRLRLLADMDTLIGKKATLRYQTLFSDTLIPQFSRVLAIRDYE